MLGAVTLLGFLAPILPQDATASARDWLDDLSDYPLAPLIAVLAYVAFATLGAPQIVLITALVVAFGPWFGFAYAWTGKVLACALGFAIGRHFAADYVRERASPAVADFMRQVAKRGFLVSALIRMVPTVPSVMVNLAAGATPIRFRDFIAGTAIGSVPKMALMAFGGHAALVAVQGHALWAWGALALIVALWALLAYFGRRWMKARRDAD